MGALVLRAGSPSASLAIAGGKGHSGMLDSVRIFDLEHPRSETMPIHPAHQQAGYSYLLHRHHEDEYRPEEAGPRTGAAGIIICGEHTGTHIDALSHQSDALVLHGGVRVDGGVQTPRGFTEQGVEEVPPILAPGVLLDVAASKGVDDLEPGYAVNAEDLHACCSRQGVGVETGSVVLVRTGNARYWNDVARYLAGPGIAASASYWLAERRGFLGGGGNNGLGGAGGGGPRPPRPPP